MKRLAGEPAQAIEHGAFDQADAEMASSGAMPRDVGPLALLPIQLPPEIEKRQRPLRDLLREIRRVADRFEHLRQILLERRRRILREPFGRQPFGGEALRRIRRRP